jgi:TIR domain
MGGSSSAAPGRIFISYRRQETAYPAGWLYERVAAHFGREQVFKDVDSIVLGDDFAEVIANAVGSCNVLLALIGDRWLTITDEDGRRRLDDPDDFVRLEIETALERNILVWAPLGDLGVCASGDVGGVELLEFTGVRQPGRCGVVAGCGRSPGTKRSHWRARCE